MGDNYYKISSIFLYNNIEPFILARVEKDKVCLIGLHSGNRWREPIVKKAEGDTVSQEEFDEIAIHHSEKFEYIGNFYEAISYLLAKKL